MDIRKIWEMFAKRVKPRADERVDPTPEEIDEMCAEIRKEWSEQTERHRRAPERPVCLDTLHRIAEDDE